MTDPAKQPAPEAEAPKKSVTQLAIESGDPILARIVLETQRQLSDSRETREIAKVIGSLSWGANLSEHARVAMANWCVRTGVDPTRHIDILGDNIYDNAELYLDKLASMPEFFDHADVVMLAPLDTRKIDVALVGEPKAKQLLEDQRKINAERLRLQMEHAVPADINQFPDTAAAALVTLHFKDGSTAVGVNWAGSRGRVKGRQGGAYDPVGDLEPGKTARTRAIRKAAKQKVPLWFKVGEFGALFERAEAALADSQARAKADGVADDPPIAVPEGSPRFQQAMRQGLEHERNVQRSGHKSLAIPAEDPYSDEVPTSRPATVTEDGEVIREVVPEPQVARSAAPWRCDRCLTQQEGAPALVEPSATGRGGAARYCSPCAAERERETA